MANLLVNQKLTSTDVVKINLCSGSKMAAGYVNIDIAANADIVLDLEEKLLPLDSDTADVLICMSAINYFTYKRAAEIIKDVYRVLKPGGIARFGTQDLRILAGKYVNRDTGFFFQKLKDGRDRFPGKTMADKLNEWFYGFVAAGKCCKYVYDYDSLKCLFEEAGFENVQQKEFRQSSVPSASELDNRPEQMFFLEAVKGYGNEIEAVIRTNDKGKQFDQSSIDINMMRNHAVDLWESGHSEEAWQLLMKIMELKPDDRKTAINCARILKSLNRYQDMEKLCIEYLQISSDQEIGELLFFAKEQSDRIKQRDLEKAQETRKKLRPANYYNTILPDQTHLAGCMQWLERAQKINDGNGVASIYRMDSKTWGVDYPETTGYIIPTFIAYHKITGLQSYLDKAIEMADWEIVIQAPEGGAGEPVGVYGLRPRIFNTGQVLLGWCSLYKQTGSKEYLQAAVKAANWIVSKQDGDGKWTENTYAGPKAYHIRVAWSLCELYAITGDDKYRVAAEKSTKWVMSQAYDNGWFENNSLSEKGKPWTHLIGYVLVGLLEVYRLNNIEFDKQKADVILINAAKNIAEHYFRSKKNNRDGNLITLPGTFDRNWSSNDQWSCLTGNAQIEYFLRKIGAYTGESAFKVTADMLVDDLKQLHLMDDINDVDMIGGLAGSFPIDGRYSNCAIPNWGVKFFADSLIQRVLGVDKQEMLG